MAPTPRLANSAMRPSPSTAPKPAAMPPQKPRSIARWMQSTLTGPTGAATRTPIRIPTGTISGLGISCMSPTARTGLLQGRTSHLEDARGGQEMGERTDATGICNEPPCPGLAGSLAPSPPHVRRLGPFALVLVMAAAPVVYWLAGNPTAA